MSSPAADALRVHRQIQASPLRERLLQLYRRAARGELVDSQGRAWKGLTDYEAAGMLKAERTSINAARNALVADGHVHQLRKRLCRYRPSQQQVWAWSLATVLHPASDR